MIMLSSSFQPQHSPVAAFPIQKEIKPHAHSPKIDNPQPNLLKTGEPASCPSLLRSTHQPTLLAKTAQNMASCPSVGNPQPLFITTFSLLPHAYIIGNHQPTCKTDELPSSPFISQQPLSLMSMVFGQSSAHLFLQPLLMSSAPAPNTICNLKYHIPPSSHQQAASQQASCPWPLDNPQPTWAFSQTGDVPLSAAKLFSEAKVSKFLPAFPSCCSTDDANLTPLACRVSSCSSCFIFPFNSLIPLLFISRMILNITSSVSSLELRPPFTRAYTSHKPFISSNSFVENSSCQLEDPDSPFSSE
nr:hypothetical protein Iba_chr09dCG0010 [Ipomoea batatas]